MKKRKGMAMMETLSMILLFVVMIVVSIRLLSVIKVKSDLNAISSELIRYAEMKGSTDIDNPINRLKQSTNFDFTVEITANNNSGKVQLGDNITIKVQTEIDIDILSIKIPFRLSSTRSGISEVYYK